MSMSAVDIFAKLLESLKRRGYLTDGAPTSMDEIRQEVPSLVLAEALAEATGYPFIDPSRKPPDPEAVNLAPRSFLLQGKALPYSVTGGRVVVLVADPTDEALMKSIRGTIRRPVAYAVSPADVLRNVALKSLEEDSSTANLIGAQLLESPQPATTTTSEDQEMRGAALTVNRIIDTAINQGATDIHCEIYNKERARIRIRIDGRLTTLEDRPREDMAAIINVIKLRAQMDVANRLLPQDGRFYYQSSDGRVASELRASVVPSLLGEEAVLRILPREGSVPRLEGLGYEESVQKALMKVVDLPLGLFLVTGPTGSGKTTTLFAVLMEILKRREPKVLSVEDPVEYRIPGVTQVQVNTNVGLSFARALRSFLRQDPDVILVGEIRDGESAKIAVEAAMTGHLVLGTLHTNSAMQAVIRLEEMGIERYKVLEALRAVLAQRLIPRLCPTCKQSSEEDKEILMKNFRYGPGITVYTRGPGCPNCSGRGYKGRIAIHELLWMDDEVRRMLLKETPTHEVEESLKLRGYRSLFEDGLRKVVDGLISFKDLIYATEVEA